MNQYELTPLPPEQHRKMRFWASVVLAAWILFCVVMLFSGCAEKDPLPTLDEKLQGVWKRQWLSLTNTYNFHQGSCDTYAIIGGQPYQYYSYAYTTQGDTLTMIDLAAIWQTGEGVSRAVVTFSDEGNEAVLSWFDRVDYELKRF